MEAGALLAQLLVRRQLRIAVYDLGGGTMDISIGEAGNGHIKIVTTNGDSRLGGKDFSSEIRTDALKKWFDRYGVDLAQRSAAFSRVWDAAETAKIELSTLPKTTVSVPHVDAAGDKGIRNMDEPITQDAFNAMIKPLIDRSLEICQRTLDGKGLVKSDIHELILVGGSTRIPYVQKVVSEFFGLKPRAGVNPEEAVVRGAAIEAARRDNRGGVDKFTMTDAASHSIGLETLNDLVHVVIPKGTPIPVQKKVTITSARDGLDKLSALIVQGDELLASKNAALAHRSIAIVAAAAGVPKPQAPPPPKTVDIVNGDIGRIRIENGAKIMEQSDRAVAVGLKLGGIWLKTLAERRVVPAGAVNIYFEAVGDPVIVAFIVTTVMWGVGHCLLLLGRFKRAKHLPTARTLTY